MLGDKRPTDRHWGGAEFFYAYPPTGRVSNIELVASMSQVVPEHSLGADKALLGIKRKLEPP